MNVPDDWAAGAARTLHEVVRLPDATVATVAVDHGAGATAGAAGSRFEIGSLTKVVTGLALASLVVDGTLGLDDRIGHWLDAGPNAHLTVVQLATHTSGLPTAAAGGVPGDPYRHLTADRAEQELRGLRPVPGAYLYSNFGYQLLGLLLERAAGESYPALLRRRVFTPLGMESAHVGNDGTAPVPAGHDDTGQVAPWTQPLPGAGAVRARAVDLGCLLEAFLEPSATRIPASLELTMRPHSVLDKRRALGLGWGILDGNLLSHTGGTNGFSAAMALDRAAGRAVASLLDIGGAAEQLRQACKDVLAGAERPAGGDQDGFDSARERAVQLARALAEGRTDELHQAMTAQLRARVPVTALATTWLLRSGGRGLSAEPEGTCRAAAGGTAVDVTLPLVDRELVLSLVFTPAGRITRIVLPSPLQAPAG